MPLLSLATALHATLLGALLELGLHRPPPPAGPEALAMVFDASAPAESDALAGGAPLVEPPTPPQPEPPQPHEPEQSIAAETPAQMSPPPKQSEAAPQPVPDKLPPAQPTEAVRQAVPDQPPPLPLLPPAQPAPPEPVRRPPVPNPLTARQVQAARKMTDSMQQVPRAVASLPNARPAPHGTPVGAPAVPSASQAVGGWRNALLAWLRQHKTYPEEARREGVQGRVMLRFTVDRSGRVLEVGLVQGSGASVLDDAAQAMLRHAQLPEFPAGMLQQKITVMLPVRYGLEP